MASRSTQSKVCFTKEEIYVCSHLDQRSRIMTRYHRSVKRIDVQEAVFYTWSDVLTAKDDASSSAYPINKIYKYKVHLKGIGAVPSTGPVWCVQDGRYCLDWNSLKPMCQNLDYRGWRRSSIHNPSWLSKVT